MIFFVSTTIGVTHMEWLLASLGRELTRYVRTLSYDRLSRMKRLPLGTYLFTHVEMLNGAALERAAAVTAELSRGGCYILNDPRHVLRRFELLRYLYDSGVNRFNVYGLSEPRSSIRFPVFLRVANGHTGSLTPLLYGPDQLQQAIDELSDKGKSRDEMIVTEFEDVADAQGRYRRYGAYRVGNRIIAGHLDFSRNWMNKGDSSQPLEPDELEEENHYIRENPHAPMLMPIFDAARIEYGRIDYGVVDRRMCVFEINTNPQLVGWNEMLDVEGERRGNLRLFVDRFCEAVTDLDSIPAGAATIDAPLRRDDRPRVRQLRETMAAVLPRLGLGRYEGHLALWMWRLKLARNRRRPQSE